MPSKDDDGAVSWDSVQTHALTQVSLLIQRQFQGKSQIRKWKNMVEGCDEVFILQLMT